MSTDSPGRRLVLLVGLQKSGTTLLQRLLGQLPFVQDPWSGREGNEFWGNTDKFLDQGPAGKLFREFGATLGHGLDAGHATPAIRESFLGGIEALASGPEPCILNKNPYNSVRLQWLKALFPDAYVIAIAREPLANTFSLVKRATLVSHRLDDGWYGVKPPGWQSLIDDDLVTQSARQWNAVNRYLVDNASSVDSFVIYDRLCAAPRASLGKMLSQLIGDFDPGDHGIPEQLHSFDREYLSGSSLVSKNKLMKRKNSFEIGADAATPAPEMEAFSATEINRISETCDSTWQELVTLSKG